MIELVSVEVTNFRSFGHATFTPLGVGQGLTAINGANGTGKSSIATHALLWALYGVTPDGVSVKALRRQDSEGEVRVTVVFRHDGQTVTVTRALRGRNDTTVAAISVDGIEQTNISAKTATAWVNARLGVDAEAFITAFVIRQKEVDALVRARPAERRALIERLAGIDRMSTALAKSREKSRLAAATAAAFGEPVDVEEINERATASQEHATQMETLAAEASEQAQTAKDAAEQARGRLTDAAAALEALQKAEHALDLSSQALSTALANRDRIAAAAVGADLLADMQAAAADASEARAEAERRVRAAATAREDAERREQDAQEASEHAATVAGREARAASTVAALKEELDARPAALDDQVELAEQRVELLAGQKSALEAERSRLDRALAALDESLAAGAAACPTCASPLAAPSALIESMREDRRGVADRADEIAVQVTQARADLSALRDEQKKFTGIHAKWQKAVAEHQAAAREAERAAGLADTANDVAESAAEVAHTAIEAARQAQEELPSLKDAEKQAQAGLRRAENAVEAEAQLPEASTAVAKAQEVVDADRAEASVLSDDAPTADEVAALRAEATRTQAVAVSAVEDAGAAQQAALLARKDADAADTAAQDARRKAQARKAALADAEAALAVAAALEEFRRDRIARLAPELSEVASDVVNVMTEGKYSTVELDEDFTPVLTETATGLQRPTSWLSGGEESAVALALRIAIGEVVSGQRAGLLVLDEVLTAHDPQRRAAVMSAIRSLSSRQVITINHVSEATDMVDLVATVLPDVTDGSVVEHSAGGGASGGGLVSEEILEVDEALPAR